jgi:hypothetical protein
MGVEDCKKIINQNWINIYWNYQNFILVLSGFK